MASVEASSVRTEAEPACWCFFLSSARNFLSRGAEGSSSNLVILELQSYFFST
jgi:hypothetical protein